MHMIKLLGRGLLQWHNLILQLPQFKEVAAELVSQDVSKKTIDLSGLKDHVRSHCGPLSLDVMYVCMHTYYACMYAYYACMYS